LIDYKKQWDALNNELLKHSNILIIIKGSPDPDAIASSFALKKIAENLFVKSDIVSFQNVSLEQNSIMIHDLNIPVKFCDSVQNPGKYDAYAVLDHQSPVYKGISELIPCAAHIDHHEIIDAGINPHVKILSRQAGSTSTIMALLLKNSGLKFSLKDMIEICTSLIIGIQTDTDKYDHASSIDFEALEYLTEYSNPDLISKIGKSPVSEYTLKILSTAAENRVLYKNWLICGAGFIDESHRDSIAIAADLILKKKEASTVIVFAAVTKNNTPGLYIDASFRSDKEDLNLNDIIKEITSEGGARKFKGAYQINIDYFINCPDRDLLWETIRLTTVEVIKKQRDGIYIIELKSAYKSLRSIFSNIFKK
jgi:nanoRNase/pAp phosphatase (c-di-AMP/oligoRNAs hydrolase)